MHTLDSSFKTRKQAFALRRRQERRRKIFGGLAAVALLAVAAAIYLSVDNWSFSDIDEDLELTDASGDLPDDASIYVPTIVDLAGDPMWIVLARGSSGEARSRSLPKPAGLTDEGISAKIEVLSDTMLSSSERFMTTIPSTQEDFAFFQAQRSTPAEIPGVLPAGDETEPATDTAVPVSQGEAVFDAGAGWGETIDAGEEALPAFRKTDIENNTSVALTTPEPERFEATEDSFVKILSNRTLDSVLLEGRFSGDDAKLAGEALNALFQRDGLQPGDVVAMRGFRRSRDAQTLSLRQVSIYSTDTYIGTLARNGNGPFVSGVDPWVRNDLFNYSGSPDEGGQKRQYRLLDAVYSTAARNNVPTGVIGEAIMYLSRGQDLSAFATYDEELILIYSDTPRGKDGGAGRVLYVAVRGGQTNLECFVYPQMDGEFACITQNDQVHSLMATNGMVAPVKGVLRSTFGPRRHPILNTVRMHKGVDWAAPVGTPIAAAFDGKIVFAGDGGGYGNLVRIEHDGGRETRYAHLQRFAVSDGVGTTVKAGEVIGYVGTTGLSTGPHLHFELYQNQVAVDPLGTVTVAAAYDLSAVETLTDRIIRVESGGRADAKNPLSSATGLGQFINKTWIRMMNTYRPDLARTLSTKELLALRFDPTISREMVRNLAREGEAYLRARGHGITAGRLYLCHFLGMDGAHQVLAASGGAPLVNVLGSSVISANPFLTGKTTGYVIDWAERKMGKRGTVTASPPATIREVKQTSPGFEEYKIAIAGVVASLQGPAAGKTEGNAAAPGATPDTATAVEVEEVQGTATEGADGSDLE